MKNMLLLSNIKSKRKSIHTPLLILRYIVGIGNIIYYLYYIDTQNPDSNIGNSMKENKIFFKNFQNVK